MSRGFAIHYAETGQGPPLVLIPGTLGSASQWSECGYAEELSRRWHVVAVDPLGHGLSDKPHEPGCYLADDVTADLVAVLDAVGVARAVVWGYSRGGWLGCCLAAADPDRVERLVVGGYAMHAHEAEVAFLSSWVRHLESGLWGDLWAALNVTDPATQRFLEKGNDPFAVAAAIEGSLRPTRFVDQVAIKCPSMHYVGSEDWIAEHVRADARAFGAPFDLVPGHAHVSAFVQAEAVLPLVQKRLEQPVAPA